MWRKKEQLKWEKLASREVREKNWRRVWGGCKYVFVTGIWKQCNLAESGSAERTNVCLMWASPGHVIALFTRGETERRIWKNIGKRSKLWVIKMGAFCLGLISSLPLNVCALVFVSYIHTLWKHTRPWNVFVLLYLDSVSKERVKGYGLLSPSGNT